MQSKSGFLRGCLIVLAAVAVLGGGIVFFVLRLTAPVVEAGDRFLTALQQEHYDEAMALCTASAQAEIEGKGGMEAFAERYKVKPAKWSYSSRSINNGMGQLQGSVAHADGSTRGLHLTFSKSGDDWKVNGFNFD